MFYSGFTACCFFWAAAIFGSCHLIPKIKCTTPPCQFQGTDDVISRYWCKEDEYSEMGLLTFNTLEDAIKCFFHGTLKKGYLNLIIYFIITFICANLTYACSIPSGLFVPCVIIGAAYGRIVG